MSSGLHHFWTDCRKNRLTLNPAVEIYHVGHEGHEVKNLRDFLPSKRTHLLGDKVAECDLGAMT